MKTLQARIQELEKRLAYNNPRDEAVEFTINVYPKETAQKFRNLLDVLNQCNKGNSRTVTFDWDGDGRDRLEVVSDGDVEPVGTEDSTRYQVIGVSAQGSHKKKDNR